MKIILTLLVVVYLLSCAPKVEVEVECTPDPTLYTNYALRKVPEEFKVYGLIKYGPMRFPMLLAKSGGRYTVKVARTRDLSLKGDKLCIKNKCYILPAPPEELIFGKLLKGNEHAFCKNGHTYLLSKDRYYEKTVIFEGGKPKEVSITNLRSGGSIKVLIGKDSGQGFFKELEFLMEDSKVKLLIEEVEI